MAGLKRGILGGTFDPIHIGHLVLAERAMEQLELDGVTFIPAGEPWRKTDHKVTPAKQRLQMVRLAVTGNPSFSVDDCEVTREGPTYTVDTLRHLHGKRPDDELFFILGQDALADMPAWHEPAAIAELATIVVAQRPGSVLDVELPFAADRLVRIEMPQLEISATELRQRAASGLSLRYLVPPAVSDYIRGNRLYSSG